MAAQPRYMSDCEKRLVDVWYEEDKEAVEEIARRLHRNRSSIWEHLGQKPGTVRARVGRKPSLTEDDKDRLVKLIEKMIETAALRYTGTLRMIQAKLSRGFATESCRMHCTRGTCGSTDCTASRS